MTVFDRQTVFVRDFDMQNDPAKWPAWWAANGVGVAWLQAHSQETPPSARLQVWARACAAAGLDIGLWGSNGLDPVRDAILVDGTRSALAADGVPVRAVVAEVERYVNPAGDTLSARYVSAFRSYDALKWMPLGVCVQADCAATFTSNKGLDYGAWYTPGATAGKDGRAVFLPECYWNQAASYDPAACIDLQVKQGWPTDRVKPVFGVWGDAGNGDKRAFDYLAQLAGRTLNGFSWYAGVTLNEFDLRVTGVMRNLGWAS